MHFKAEAVKPGSPARKGRSVRVFLRNRLASERRKMRCSVLFKKEPRMARQLDIAMLVPQHGAPLTGPAIGQFFDWVESLQCGVDRVDDRNYPRPTAQITA